MIDTLTRWLAACGDAAALLLLETLIKATVLVGAACFSAALLHRASAAVRHRVWGMALVALLLLPVLAAVLPGWCPPFLSSLGWPIGAASSPSPDAVPHLPTCTEPNELAAADGVLQKVSASASPDALPVDPPPEDAKRDAVRDPERTERQTVAPVGALAPSAPWTIAVSWQAVIVLLWLLGLAVSFLHVAVRLVRNRVLLRFARPVVDCERDRLFTGLCRELDVRRPVRLLESETSPIPMTWGVLRPIVLVPLDWRQWPFERQRIVLLHELAHVKRGDVACHWLGRLACAVYWFHPLVWYSLRRLRIEQEMACDDCVLRAGERPTDYAGHLLELARYCRALALPAAAAMAQSTGLERRVRALLDQTRSHLPVSRTAGRSVLACGAILLTVVAMVGPASTSEPRLDIALSPIETPPGVTEMLAQQPSASLSGHAAAVWFVGCAPDGKTLVSAARDGTIKVWRLPGGAVLATLKGVDDGSKKHELYCAALSSDGKKLATAGRDATITLWDITTRKKLRTIAGHTGAVLSVAFSPDGKTLVSGGMDRVLRVWDAVTGKAVHDFQGHSFRIQSVAFSPDGETILSGDQGNTVKFWQAHAKKYMATIPPDGAALALACAPDDQGLAVGVDHGSVELWTRSPQGQLQRRSLEGHIGDVTAVAFAPGGGLVASSGLDGMIKLWDVKTGRRLSRVLAHAGGVRSLAFSANGSLLASGGEDQAVKLWDMAKLTATAEAEPPKPPLQEPPRSLRPARLESFTAARIKMLDGVFLGKGSGASWSPDGRRLAFNKPLPESGVAIVDPKTGRQSTLVDVGRDPAWSPKDENVIAYVRSEEGDSEIWVAGTAGGQPRRIAEGSSPAWSPDGKTLYFISAERTLRGMSWPIRGEAPQPETVARDVGRHPGISADGKQVAFFGRGGFLDLIDRPSGKASTIRTIPGRENAFIRWSPDGKQIACGGVTDGVQTYGLWILDSLEAPPLTVVRGMVNRPAWSPDGSKLAFDFERVDGVEIWMIETRSLAPRKAFHAVHQPKGKPAYLNASVPFNPKGKVIPLNLNEMQDRIWALGSLSNPLDDLPDLPRGEKVLAGVKFNIGPRPLQLGTDEHSPHAPDKVEGIPVHRPVARLYVLHGSGQGDPYTGYPNRQAIADYRPRPTRSSAIDAVPDGATIAYYRVRYEDGSDQWIAVCEGDDVRDWCSWQPVTPTRGTVAWKAYNEATTDRANARGRQAVPMCIFAGAWQNPHPEKPVATIDYLAAGTPAAPFCVAISVEEPDAQ